MSVSIQSCIVCDMIRPEINGKLMILGFLGVCPYVDIRLPRLDRPTPLTFLLSGHLDGKVDTFAVEILSEKDGVSVASTREGQIGFAETTGAINVAPTLLVTFGRPGGFMVRCLADGRECYTGKLTVAQGEASAG